MFTVFQNRDQEVACTAVVQLQHIAVWLLPSDNKANRLHNYVRHNSKGTHITYRSKSTSFQGQLQFFITQGPSQTCEWPGVGEVQVLQRGWHVSYRWGLTAPVGLSLLWSPRENDPAWGILQTGHRLELSTVARWRDSGTVGQTGVASFGEWNFLWAKQKQQDKGGLDLLPLSNS